MSTSLAGRPHVHLGSKRSAADRACANFTGRLLTHSGVLQWRNGPFSLSPKASVLPHVGQINSATGSSARSPSNTVILGGRGGGTASREGGAGLARAGGLGRGGGDGAVGRGSS